MADLNGLRQKMQKVLDDEDVCRNRSAQIRSPLPHLDQLLFERLWSPALPE